MRKLILILLFGMSAVSLRAQTNEFFLRDMVDPALIDSNATLTIDYKTIFTDTNNMVRGHFRATSRIGASLYLTNTVTSVITSMNVATNVGGTDWLARDMKSFTHNNGVLTYVGPTRFNARIMLGICMEPSAGAGRLKLDVFIAKNGQTRPRSRTREHIQRSVNRVVPVFFNTLLQSNDTISVWVANGTDTTDIDTMDIKLHIF